ncbi:uncharacterized protein LOC144078830 isoform X3 [Stigmatopora argus]
MGSMDSSTDKTRKNLRKHLDHMGYRLHFGIDSVPLVAKLFSDLVQTTTSLRDAKLSAEKRQVSPKSPRGGGGLDAGDHFRSQGEAFECLALANKLGLPVGLQRKVVRLVSGVKKTRVVVSHQATQTDEDEERAPPSGQEEEDDDLSERLAELQEELLSVKSDLDESRGRAKASDVELTELREAQRTLERSLASKDEALAHMVALKEQAFSMAYRKLSASKEVILGQQEIIRDLEVNLRKIKVDVRQQSPLKKHLAEAKGRNQKLQGLVAALGAQNATREQLDDLVDIERDSSTREQGSGDCANRRSPWTTSPERECHAYKSVLPVVRAVNFSPSLARRAKFTLAATFRGNAS